MNVVHPKAGLTRLPLLAAAFVAVVCLTILGISASREWTSRATTLKAAEVEMANLARSLTQHAEDSLDLLDASILGAVGRLETEGAGPEIVEKLQAVFVARKAGLKRIHGLIICDENGNRLTSGTGGKNLTDREYFRHHQQSTAKDAFIGHPVKAASDGEWIVTVSRRFNHRDGRFAGVVLASIGAKYFSDFYRQFDVGANSAIALLTRDGVVVARTPDNGTYVGRDLSGTALFRDASLQTTSGVYEFRSALDGMQRMSIYQRSDRFPVVLLATVQREEVLAPWRQAAITRMLFVLGLVILIAMIGLRLVRQLLHGQRMAAALASKEANFRVLAEGSSDMVTRIRLDDEVMSYVSPSSVRILGWRHDQLIGTPALAGVNPEDLPRIAEVVEALRRGDVEEARLSYRTRHKEKSEIWLESSLRVTRNIKGEIEDVIAISRDVTEQKAFEGKLATLATEDGLTGLANRRRFDERLLEEWGRAYRDRTSLALLMIDIDRFKSFNDEYGHQAGDECLRAIARVLAAEAQRTVDLAARYGGEEFAMLLPNTDAAGCARIGERLRHALREAGIPHAQNLPSGLVTASLGGAVCQPGAERSAGPASLIEAADRALYAAKDGGRDQLVMAKQTVWLLPLASGAR
jgi:diguanylate cyclase (GGDEF)-like protein/PAS domain S-box-containing protein